MAVDVNRVDRMTVITINCPEVRNAVDGPTAEALAEAFAAGDVFGVYCRRWGVPLVAGGKGRHGDFGDI
jgi:1,4-dihydroxy-2-naphthoyl-CoA synthase